MGPIGWYLMELRKILVRKFLATRTSLSDGIVRADTTSTILALTGSKWWEEREGRGKGQVVVKDHKKKMAFESSWSSSWKTGKGGFEAVCSRSKWPPVSGWCNSFWVWIESCAFTGGLSQPNGRQSWAAQLSEEEATDQQEKPSEIQNKRFGPSPSELHVPAFRQVQLSGLSERSQTNESRVVLTWTLDPARRDGGAAFFHSWNAERSYPPSKWDGCVSRVPGPGVGVGVLLTVLDVSQIRDYEFEEFCFKRQEGARSGSRTICSRRWRHGPSLTFRVLLNLGVFIDNIMWKSHPGPFFDYYYQSFHAISWAKNGHTGLCQTWLFAPKFKWIPLLMDFWR